MNWLQKIARPIRTQDVPNILAQAIAYECGGEWKVSGVKQWTEDLEQITRDKRLGEEVGYSTSFWINCPNGDGLIGEKWGVSVNFTVLSGSSHTIIDSETGGWDFVITANVQWASPESWTSGSPYALLVKSVGHREDMATIQEVAQFVKESILSSRKKDNDDGFDQDDNDDDPMFPDWPYGEDDFVKPETDEELSRVRAPRIRGYND